MDKLKVIYDWYMSLGKRGKILIGFAAIVLALALFECLTGCSAYKLSKTWSF